MSCSRELRVGSLAGTGGTAYRASTERGRDSYPSTFLFRVLWRRRGKDRKSGAWPMRLVLRGKCYLNTYVLASVDPMHAHDNPAALDQRIVEAANLMANAVGGTLHIFHAQASWPKAL